MCEIFMPHPGVCSMFNTTGHTTHLFPLSLHVRQGSWSQACKTGEGTNGTSWKARGNMHSHAKSKEQKRTQQAPSHLKIAISISLKGFSILKNVCVCYN